MLRFDALPLGIRGRIVTADGEPARGWRVKLLGGTVLTTDYLSDESVLEGRLTASTDRDGRFALVGLDERPYTLVAFKSDDGLVDRREGVVPGPEEIDWIVPADVRTAELRGVVVSTAGDPLPGARVFAQSTTTELDSGAGTLRNSMQVGSATTDGEGRFLLRNVPRRYGTLGVSAPEGLRADPVEVALADVDPAEELVIEVPFLRPLQVDLIGADRADDGRRLAVEVRDGAGRALTLRNYGERSSYGTNFLSWDSRRWRHVWVSEFATEAVLLDMADPAQLVLDRAPIEFTRDGWARIALTAP